MAIVKMKIISVMVAQNIMNTENLKTGNNFFVEWQSLKRKLIDISARIEIKNHVIFRNFHNSA